MAKTVDTKSIAMIALLVTVFLLLTIIIIASLLNNARKDIVGAELQSTYNSLAEMQTFLLMSEAYGSEMACIAFTQKLRSLDKDIWDLGVKLDEYRVASEEIKKSSFYEQQKEAFNEQELIYMLLVRNLQRECDYEQVIISFFYTDSSACPKCDDQSFVLTDINKQFDKEISVFSYDVDLNLTSVNLLKEYYEINEYPCVVIDDVPHCGITDASEIRDAICEKIPDAQGCI